MKYHAKTHHLVVFTDEQTRTANEHVELCQQKTRWIRAVSSCFYIPNMLNYYHNSGETAKADR